MAPNSAPLFTALATSTRQLHLLLRCIAFASKADVYITLEGLRFTVQETQVVQASTLLDKNLFSSYTLNSSEDDPSIPPFQVNISALLDTLQIFGISDTASNFKNQNGGFTSYPTAFNTPALALTGTCRITYSELGAPLSIIIEEGGVKTTCEMNTYGIPNVEGDENEIPLDRTALVLKIIMKSAWLHDAMAELAGTNPEVLLVNASSVSAPYFALEGQEGPFGDSIVEFNPDTKSDSTPSSAKYKKQPLVTETFSVTAPSGTHGRLKQKYKFDLIKKAGKAMAIADKVCVRQDRQGVLSLQFMISGIEGTAGEIANKSAARMSFIDFRFVPLLDADDDYGSENGTTESE